MRDFDTLAALLTGYVFYYPVIMSIFWMVGGIYFYWRRERGQATEPPKLARRPLVSVLVPAHNEERDIEDAVRSIFHNSYANLEVIVINDAIWSLSIHRHGHITDEMEEQARRARIAYSRTFLPEYLPLRAKDRPA